MDIRIPLIVVLFAACLGPGCRRGPAPEKAPSPAPKPIPEMDRSGYPVLQEEEVRKLASLRDRFPEFDVTRTNVFTFEFRYGEDRERLDRILASAGLTKRKYTQLMVDAQKILTDRVKILEPFDRMLEAGGGEAPEWKPGDEEARKLREIAQKAEKVRAGVALLERYGFIE